MVLGPKAPLLWHWVIIVPGALGLLQLLVVYNGVGGLGVAAIVREIGFEGVWGRSGSDGGFQGVVGKSGSGGGFRGRSVAGYLGLALVFVWNSALRKGVGRNFSGLFCQCLQNFYFDGH